MNILLIDVDSKIPNLALMKISSYYKNKGDNVELIRLNVSYYPSKNKNKTVNGEGYDKVFISIIFNNNKHILNIENNNNTYFGGSGVSLDKELPLEIENCTEDYSIYPGNDISYGFITRGCIRKCDFCIVPKKEGKLYVYDTIDNIVKHKKVKFMDNNILAYKNHKYILQELIDKKIKCQFNQGLDIRLINEVNTKLLSNINYLGEYIFAFDDIKLESIINTKLKIIKKYITKDWKLKFFIYCNPKMDIFGDVVYRVKWCKNNLVLPYLMRDLSCWDSNNSEFYVDLAAYCNQPNLFKKMTFEQFLIKRHSKNRKRQIKSLAIWENSND